MNANMLPTIVYCATREKDLEEVEVSLRSVRKFYPDIEVCLFTCFADYSNELIDCIEMLSSVENNFLDKIQTFIQVKRKNILFLDGDTLLIHPINDLFALLEKFELAVAHAPNRWTVKLDTVPDSFPEFNTGVVLLKKNLRVRRLLKNWFKKYVEEIKSQKKSPSKDQPSFRECLYQSKVRFTTITPEFNCRFTMGAMVSHTVKLLHGRTKDFNTIKESINAGPINTWSGEPKVRWIKYN